LQLGCVAEGQLLCAQRGLYIYIFLFLVSNLTFSLAV